MTKIIRFLITAMISGSASIAFSYQDDIKKSICREGFACWIQNCPYDANMHTPIEERRIQFIAAGYDVSDIKTSSVDANFCGFDYAWPQSSRPVAPQGKSEKVETYCQLQDEPLKKEQYDFQVFSENGWQCSAEAGAQAQALASQAGYNLSNCRFIGCKNKKLLTVATLGLVDSSMSYSCFRERSIPKSPAEIQSERCGKLSQCLLDIAAGKVTGNSQQQVLEVYNSICKP